MFRKCEVLLHPMFCVRCKFSCVRNMEMVAHFETTEHIEVIEASDRPCIVKESKTQVICKICDSIVAVSKLQDHITAEHLMKVTRGKRNACDTSQFCACCDKQWESESALAVHLARKGGYKPYQCPICNQAFTTNSDLTRHCQSEKHVDVAIKLGTKVPRVTPVSSQSEAATGCQSVEKTVPIGMFMLLKRKATCVSTMDVILGQRNSRNFDSIMRRIQQKAKGFNVNYVIILLIKKVISICIRKRHVICA